VIVLVLLIVGMRLSFSRKSNLSAIKKNYINKKGLVHQTNWITSFNVYYFINNKITQYHSEFFSSPSSSFNWDISVINVSSSLKR